MLSGYLFGQLVCFPHTRGGGPAMAVAPDGTLYVFPTRVGVDRSRATAASITNKFSPHAWGWTYHKIKNYLVNPRFPHTRGGGP